MLSKGASLATAAGALLCATSLGVALLCWDAFFHNQLYFDLRAGAHSLPTPKRGLLAVNTGQTCGIKACDHMSQLGRHGIFLTGRHPKHNIIQNQWRRVLRNPSCT